MWCHSCEATMFGSEGINGVRVSHPVLNPVTDPLYRTSSDPDWIHQTSGLLFEPSAPLTLTYSLLTRHPRTPLQTPLASGHWLHSAPSSRLPFHLTYLICVYPLASVSLYQTPTPVLTHRTLTGPPIWTCSLSI